MKKNFMAIASLLVAAMLLMVSCAQEVKAPENNGLVEAKLSVGYGRDLSVSGNTKTDSLTYKYTMTQGWTSASGDETVIGAVSEENEKVFQDNQSIGYVTPGLWNITVNAYETVTTITDGETTSSLKKIFTGTASVYFSSQNQSATVYLAPVDDSTNSIKFSITMQDLSSTPDTFELKYSIYKGSDSSTVTNGTGTLTRAANNTAHVSTYSGSVSSLASGYYRVTVSVYDKTNNKNVGGITKGFLISGGATANITGHIEPADFENVKIDTVFVNVNTGLSVSKVTGEGESKTEESLSKEEGKDYYKVDYVNGTPAKIKVTMEDNTNTTLPTGATVTKTLFWNTVSDKTETNDKKDIQTANTDTKEFTFTAPGHKYITCTTVYKVTGASTGETSTDYYFADSQTVHVFIDPTTYNNSLNQTN